MRTFLLLAALVVSSSAIADGLDPRLQSLNWLLGHWERTGLPEGRSGHEHWQVEGSDLAGLGAMQRDGQTLFEEKLRIVAEDDGVFYIADVPGNAAPVRFRLTEQAANAATFENPEHDFPQKIAYRREGEQLHALISGNGREIGFAFRLH